MKRKLSLLILTLSFSLLGILNAQISFQEPISIPTNGGSSLVKVIDINQDSLNEVILITQMWFTPLVNDDSVLFYKQDNSGELYLAQVIRFEDSEFVNSLTLALDFADINNDGLDDIVITYNDNIKCYTYNPENGLLEEFHSILELTVESNGNIFNSNVDGLALGDINGDELIDIVVGLNSGYHLKFFINQDSTGTNFVSYQESVPNSPGAGFIEMQQLADWDFPKLIFKAFYSLYSVEPENNQANSFSFDFLLNMSPYITGGEGDLEFEDINNDGFKDIITNRPINSGNLTRELIFIYLYDPETMNFTYESGLLAYDVPESIEFIDLNQDGDKELISIHGGWEALTIYEKNEEGNYELYTVYEIPYSTHYHFIDGFSVGDVNNDGEFDIVIADYNYGMTILYGLNSTPTFEEEIPSFQIFPNPTQGTLTIFNENSYSFGTAMIELYDPRGRLVFNQKINKKLNTIDISHLNPGIYFLKVIADKERYISTVFKL